MAGSPESGYYVKGFTKGGTWYELKNGLGYLMPLSIAQLSGYGLPFCGWQLYYENGEKVPGELYPAKCGGKGLNTLVEIPGSPAGNDPIHQFTDTQDQYLCKSQCEAWFPGNSQLQQDCAARCAEGEQYSSPCDYLRGTGINSSEILKAGYLCGNAWWVVPVLVIVLIVLIILAWQTV